MKFSPSSTGVLQNSRGFPPELKSTRTLMPFLVLRVPSKEIKKKKKAHDGSSSSQVSCSCSCMLTSSQVGISHGAAQALGAPLSECPVVQEPSEDAGGQRGHQTRVHWAETECGAAGEQEDEGWEERVYVFATFFKINAWKVKTWLRKISSLGFCSFENKAVYRFITN